MAGFSDQRPRAAGTRFDAGGPLFFLPMDFSFRLDGSPADRAATADNANRAAG